MIMRKVLVLTTIFVLLITASGSSFAAMEDPKPLETEKTTSKPPKPPASESPTAGRYYRPNQSPYRVMPELEVPLIFIAAAVTTVPRMMVSEQGGPWCGLDCDSDDINALDRLTVNQASQAWGDVSDYVMFSFMPLPYIFDLIDVAASDPHDGWRGYGSDFLVLLETMTASLCVNSLVAMVVRRPRPYVYNDDVDDDFRLKGEATMSFYSGHTSVVFALATAYSRLFMLRHPESPLIVPVWLFTYASAAMVGVARVVSGSHFITDSVIGAATGIGLGLLIPWLHELPEEPSSGRANVHVRPYFAGVSAGVIGRF